MKYYSIKSTFHNPWREVAVAFWNRYPNPKSSHVLSEDTIFRKVVGHLIYSKRFLVKTNRMPKWGEKIMSGKQVTILEESILDRLNQRLVTYTRNIGHYSGLLSIEEKCTYTVDPEKPDSSTVLVREAWIGSHVRGLSHVIVAFATERFKHNSSNAFKGFVMVLDRLFPKEKDLLMKSEITRVSLSNKVHEKLETSKSGQFVKKSATVNI